MTTTLVAVATAELVLAMLDEMQKWGRETGMRHNQRVLLLQKKLKEMLPDEGDGNAE